MTVGAYDDEIATVLELIEEAGQQCVWRKRTTDPDEADRPWLGGDDDSTEYQPFIAFVPATDAGLFGMTKFRQGEDVPKFSTFGLMGPQEFTPEVGDVLLRDNVPQVLAAVDTLRPAEDAVLHVLSIV